MNKELYNKINMLLWDLTVAQRNIQILHWNIKDTSFIYMHKYLGEVYDTLFQYIDMTAEQIRFLDEFPVGNLSDAIKNSKIPAVSSTKTYSHKEVVCLAISNIMALRNAAYEVASFNDGSKELSFIGGFSDQIGYYTKVLYFLRNSLIDSCN